MADDKPIPADVYQAARDMFTNTAVATARALAERAGGDSYTLRFDPIIDRVVDLVWDLAHQKGGKRE